MHRLAAPLALGALLALCAPPPAAATPSTGAFQSLLVELNARDGALPATGGTREQKKERKVLAKAFRALARESDGLAGDLAIAVKMTRTLERGYPGDSTILSLLDGTLDALEGLLRDGRDEVEVIVSLLAEGKWKDRSSAKLAAADAALVRSLEPGFLASRAKQLLKAWKQVEKGGKLAAKGDPGGSVGDSTMAATVKGLPWAANTEFGTGVSGLASVSEGSGGLRKVIVRGRRILPSSGNPQLPGVTSTLQITVQTTRMDLEPGTWSVGNNLDGVSVSVSWIEEAEDGSVQNGVGLSGSVTLSTILVGPGSVTVTGTFGFTLFDGSGTFAVSGGTFEAEGLPRVPVQ